MSSTLASQDQAPQQSPADTIRVYNTLTRTKAPLEPVTPEAVERLAAELLLYPGAFGIPLASGIEKGDGFSVLVARHREAWVSGFCRTKLAAMRVLAVGRGRDFHRTVDRYAEFLDALGRGKRPERLTELLYAAEAEMRSLEAAARAEPDDPRDEADDGN